MTTAQRMMIGEASFPSGIALLIDFGTLHLWQHTRPPVWPEAAEDPAGDGLVDMQLQGPHAEHAGRELGRQWHPHFLYDLAREDIGEVQQAIGQLAARGISAGVAPLPQRVPHRTRVEYALRHGRGGGEVPFFAMKAVAVAGLPPGVRVPVVGTRTADDDGHWHEVTLEVNPNAPVANREKDRDRDGRLRAAHVHGRRCARHVERPAVGRRPRGLRVLGAPRRGGRSSFQRAGARRRSVRVEEPPDPRGDRTRHRHRAGEDERPEREVRDRLPPATQSWKLLEQIRATPTESGVLDLGPARVAGFMTTWGDGTFTVYRDLDPQGRLVRMGVVFDDGDDDSDDDDDGDDSN